MTGIHIYSILFGLERIRLGRSHSYLTLPTFNNALHLIVVSSNPFLEHTASLSSLSGLAPGAIPH